jgi:hypothetical protein
MTTATLEQVHNQKSHRLDATMIARLFGLTLKDLAGVISASPDSLRRRPDGPSFQSGLGHIAAAYDELSEILSDSAIKSWMRHPLRGLANKTPLAYATEHGPDVLEALTKEVTSGGYG